MLHTKCLSFGLVIFIFFLFDDFDQLWTTSSSFSSFYSLFCPSFSILPIFFYPLITFLSLSSVYLLSFSWKTPNFLILFLKISLSKISSLVIFNSAILNSHFSKPTELSFRLFINMMKYSFRQSFCLNSCQVRRILSFVSSLYLKFFNYTHIITYYCIHFRFALSQEFFFVHLVLSYSVNFSFV